MIPSIFNNVIGPVMRGPSSSHTAASVRIGHLARKLLGEEPVSAVFHFDLSGSLAATFRGQGSAMGLASGLLGMEITDPDMIGSEEKAVSSGLAIEYLTGDYGDSHPNTYRSTVTGSSGRKISFTALSKGGGVISLTELNGKPVDDDFDFINPLMPVRIRKYAKPLFNDMKGGMKLAGQEGIRLSDLARDYESSVGNISVDEIDQFSGEIYRVMRDAIENGLGGTTYSNRILQQQSQLISQASEKGKLIPSDITNSIIASVSAIMETKSSMGIIVAAPTAGSCGTIGGTVIPVADIMGKSDREISNAILAAGITGILIEMGAGFAAEEGGCQYECGSASGMTAAALVELAGGDAKTAFSAASMALQNTIGMVCDPVADRVEVPCLGKNIMAAMNALAAANMALAGYDHLIPLDEVIGAMKEVGTSMDQRYRCTCKGGLSLTETARKIYKTLND